MKTHDPQNERIKREYFIYLKEAKRYSVSSLDGVAQALERFESYTGFRDFRKFHRQQAVGFKVHLSEERNQRTGDPLSKATLLSTLNALKAFFTWLAGRPGYKSRLNYADSDYFNLSDKEMRVARAHRERRAPTLGEIRQIIGSMPSETEIERRDRALMAFTILTGARDGAIASLKLKHIDLSEGKVDQDAREVKTKASKTITTYFFPVGDDIRAIVTDWAQYLRSEKQYGPDDPLFPATLVSLDGDRQFQGTGLRRAHWSDAARIRVIFKRAFARAGLPYANPHSFRKTLALLGEQICRSPEEFKAWSQNLGHEKVMTTFSSYGDVGIRRQAEIIRDLARASEPRESVDELACFLAETLRKSGKLQDSGRRSGDVV